MPKDQRKRVEKALDVTKVASKEDALAEIGKLRDKIAANPESSANAEALFRIGVLNEKIVGAPERLPERDPEKESTSPKELEGDFEGALNAYATILENYKKSPFASVAAYRQGELLCQSDDEQKRRQAIQAYESVVGMSFMPRGTRSTSKGKGSKMKARPVPVVAVETADGEVKWEPAEGIVREKLDRLYQQYSLRYMILDALVKLCAHVWPGGAKGMGLILLAVLVKALLTPFTKKQYQSMSAMQKVQPEVKKLQEKLKGNPQKLNQEVMALYKKHGVNPLGGCLPLVIQMPVLIWLYRSINQYKFQLQQEPHGFLWIDNLAKADMPLLVLYVLSMIVSQKLTTTPAADPQQQQTQKMMMFMMPVMFAFMFKQFPSAFILYWFMFNVLSTTQQFLIMRGQADANDRKLGIKTLIPNFGKPQEKEKKGGSPPAVTPPKDLDTSSRTPTKRRKKKRRRKK